MASEQSLVTMLSELINVQDLVNNREVEFKYNKRDIRIHYFNTVIQIIDVTNAKKRGKTCVKVNVRINNHEDIDPCKYVRETNMATLETFFENCENHEVNYTLKDIKHQGYKYDVVVVASKDVIPAQCNLKNIYKPITELKLKSRYSIKISDIIRILINNNVQVIQDGRYTDDYAWDSATNYNEGHTFNPVEFAKELIKSRSGWSAYVDREDQKRIHINCYSFDCRSIYLDIPVKVA